MSVEADVFNGQGFIGAGLNWNALFELEPGDYWNVFFIARGGSLTINGTTSRKDATGRLELLVNFTNNTASDTYFDTRLINLPA
jgi:hypothetical protein